MKKSLFAIGLAFFLLSSWSIGLAAEFKFIDRDLYIFVYDMNGKCLAHGFNQKMIDKDLLEMKDPDGKFLK